MDGELVTVVSLTTEIQLMVEDMKARLGDGPQRRRSRE
jgi:hypothetical protein